MIKNIFMILFLFNVFSHADVGWKGNSIEVSGISYTDSVVEVTADDQVIAVALDTVVSLSSDSPTAVNRNIVLQKPTKNNHLLILKFVEEGTGKLQLADNSPVNGSTGVVNLGGLWNPNNNNTLTLIYSDPDYIEISRSNN